MVSLPQHLQIYEFTSSSVWFDEDGLLWSITRKSPPRTMERAKKDIGMLKEILGGRKACMVIDVTYLDETTKEVRDFIVEELKSMTKAIGLVSRSALGRMLANVFFTVPGRTFPVRFFDDVDKAKRWLSLFK
jgi:hypothetical protein